MDLADLRRDLRNAGLVGVAYDVGYRLAKKITTVMILQTLKLTPGLLNPVPWSGDKEFHHLYLEESQLRLYARDPANDLTDGFLDEALAKGDWCSAILHGERLVNYAWCARNPTRLPGNLLLEFGADWVYRYKAFTIPSYRGRRLQGMNTTITLGEIPALGLKGFICYADVTNYSSLKSMSRLGFVDVGKMYALRVPGACLIRVDPRCRIYGLNLKSA